MSYKVVSIESLPPISRLALAAAMGTFEGAEEITLNRAEQSALVRYGNGAKAFMKGALHQSAPSKPTTIRHKRLRARGFYASQIWADKVAEAEERAGEAVLMTGDVAKMAHCDKSAVTRACRQGQLKNWAHPMRIGPRPCYLYSITEATQWASQYRSKLER